MGVMGESLGKFWYPLSMFKKKKLFLQTRIVGRTSCLFPNIIWLETWVKDCFYPFGTNLDMNHISHCNI